MPKSRGRKGRRSPQVRRFSQPGQWAWTGLAKDQQPAGMTEDEWAPTPRRAMVGVCVTKGRRFDPGSQRYTGPAGEAWTNAWYTAKENKDKGWRYCEGICKYMKDDGTTGLITTAWVVDSFGHVVETTPGIDADWYQGFVIDEDNEMMNPKNAPEWDEGLPRPVMADSEEGILDGQRQLEAVSRTTGDGWLGSMLETAIAALNEGFGMTFARGAFLAVDNIVDREATNKLASEAPNVLDDPAAFEEISAVYPERDAATDYREANRDANRPPQFKIADTPNPDFWKGLK